MIGNGRGIHWLDLDEDISVENLLTGQPSGESQTSFKRWLGQRPDDRSPKRDRTIGCSGAVIRETITCMSADGPLIRDVLYAARELSTLTHD